MKELTHAQMVKKGGEATKRKYGREHYRTMSEKGKRTLLEKYGPDYFKEFSRKGVEARRQKKLALERKDAPKQSHFSRLSSMILGKRDKK